MNARLFSLLEKHQRIGEAIAREQDRPLPDRFAVIQLKKRKLRVKDMMQKMLRRRAEA